MKTRLVKYCLIAAASNLAAAQDVTDYVNPFIGTANGGNTFPGAVRPWGMVSVSPHTTFGAPSGYLHGEKFFYSRQIQQTPATVQDSAIGAWFHFSTTTNKSIFVKVGISYVSIENARLNLDAEIHDWDFARIKTEARTAWQNELSRIRVEGESREELIKFYTALYHTLIHPNLISDVNGEYPLMGRTGTGKYVGRDRYTVFSLWDTYRTLHPFLTLVYPERQSAIIIESRGQFSATGAVKSVKLNGRRLQHYQINHRQIVVGGRLVFE